MSVRVHLRHLPALAALCLLAASAPVAAAPLESAAAQQAFFVFDIPAGPLDGALKAFQAGTGLTVTVPQGISVAELTSPGAAGTLTPDQALAQILAGTGLSVRLAGPNSYQVEVQPISERVEVTASLPYQTQATLTGTRTFTPLRDVPQATTVITRAVISDLSMQSMADVSRYMPGVGFAQGEGNRDTPILRGIGTTGDFFVDGVRDDVQYYRDVYNVERVEALKGPNAMIFGRSGVGGVINRATRQADWGTSREVSLQAGADSNRRLTFDLDQPVTSTFAARLTGVYENSGSYRRGVDLERYGFNPTAAFMIRNATTLRVGYEYFHDERTADRGIPSLGNRPVPTAAETFFGDPDLSVSRANVNVLTAGLDHNLGRGATIRNRTVYADYDKLYQNVYPSAAVSADGTTATIGAYNNATTRRNLFSQTDLTFTVLTGGVKHVLLAGSEFGRQDTDNFRNTGFFTSLGPNVTAYPVSVANPTISVPVTFRQSASDADNQALATVAAVYGQDQVELTRHVRAVVGVRLDRFNVDFRNNRTAVELTSRNTFVSPRVGVIYKPVEPASFYASYSIAYQPRAGEHLASLSVTNRTLDPETYRNREVGVKWDLTPGLSFTTAVYRLTLSNDTVPDPADPTRLLLVDGVQTTGFEADVTGSVTSAWSIVSAYAYQTGKYRETLNANLVAGARPAQLPAHALSLWNRYDVSQLWGFGVGLIHNAERFTATTNTVTLPAFTRVDGALFLSVSRKAQLQVNLENLFDEDYYAFAHSNTNITPGAPRTFRVTLISRF